jgi:hypothetical protein
MTQRGFRLVSLQWTVTSTTVESIWCAPAPACRRMNCETLLDSVNLNPCVQHTSADHTSCARELGR